MEDNNFSYTPLGKEELKKIWKKHKKIIESFINNNGYDNKNIYVSETTVMAVIAKVHQRKKYFEYFHNLVMSECKEVALICFWYIKLRPICAVSEKIEMDDEMIFSYINERLALYYIIVTLRGLLESEKISTQKLDELPESYLKELLYSFKYRDLSKETIILLVESMAVFLGLNPYSEVVENTKPEQ